MKRINLLHITLIILTLFKIEFAQTNFPIKDNSLHIKEQVHCSDYEQVGLKDQNYNGILKFQQEGNHNNFIEWIQSPNPLPFPNPHRGFGCISNENYIFIFGGDSTGNIGGMDYVAFSPILSDGSIGNWNQTTDLPVPLWETEAVRYQNYIYIIAGFNSESVFKANINLNGTLGEWQVENPLPSAIYGHTAVLNGNIIYVMGDWFNAATFYSEIDSNGNLGLWNTTTSLPVRLYASDAIVHNGRIYIFGGKEIVGGNQELVSTVRYAEILSDGQLGEWLITDSLMAPVWFHQVVNIDDNVFVMGGWGVNGGNYDVQKGILNPDGSISWTLIGQNPEVTEGNGLILENKYLYYLSGAWSNSIYYANIESYITNIENHQPYPFSYSTLEQNYPNPFNPTTTIKYQIPGISFVTLKVYDVLGKEITKLVNEEKPAGTYELTWNATDLPSGVYFYRLQAGDFIDTKKMLLIK